MNIKYVYLKNATKMCVNNRSPIENANILYTDQEWLLKEISANSQRAGNMSRNIIIPSGFP